MDDVVVAGGEAVSRAADGEGMASQHQERQDGGEYGLEHGERLCFADLIFAAMWVVRLIDIRYLMGRERGGNPHPGDMKCPA